MALRRPPSSRAPQGRLSFEYEVVQDTGSVTSYGGLPLVVDVMRSQGLSASVQNHVKVHERERVHTDVSIIEDLVLTMAAGGDCLADVEMLRADKALGRLLGRAMISEEGARKFLYAFHDDELLKRAQEAAEQKGEASYVPEENAALSGLGRANEDFVRAVAAKGTCTTATLDLDATLAESQKKEAKWHYDGGRGYQPVLVVWAEQDMVVADEFRDGNVPAGKDTLRVTKKAFEALPSPVTRRRFRGDSACYNEEQLLWLLQEGIEFTISADMTEALKATCARVEEAEWKLLESRGNELVHVTEVRHFTAWWQQVEKMPRYLAVRLTPTQGRLFEDGVGPKYLAVCTNREGPVEDLLRWHWEKAGTIEHVHDVVKNELGGGTLPCGRFGANAAWFRLSVVTYNVLSALKSLALPPKLHDARPKRLRFQVFTLPAIVSEHARTLWARLVDRLGWAMDTALARRRLWPPALPA